VAFIERERDALNGKLGTVSGRKESFRIKPKC